ncbi:MAG: type IX secretion system sortase PorU [Bacteroidales bacterium]|nr:type IX secretion system sortase PorU [Bacteroidales bacterium]
MKFFYNINLLVLFFIFSNRITANTRTLVWELTDSSTLKFIGAQYAPGEKNIPCYIETFYLDYQANVSISNIRTEVIAGDFNHLALSDSLQWQVFSGKSRNKYFYQLVFIPVRKSEGKIETVVSFNVNIIPIYNAKKETSSTSYSSSSVLSRGKWYKLKVSQEGIYRITYAQLKNWGFTNLDQIQIFGNGGGMLPISTKFSRKDDLTKIPIYIEKGTDGLFNEGDYLLFFGQGPHIWKFNPKNRRFYHQKHQYSDFNYYFITDSQGSTVNIEKVPYQPDKTSVIEISNFDDYQFFESDEVNLLHSGSVWYGNVISNQTSRTFTANFSNLDLSIPAFIYYDILSEASTPGTFTFSVGSTTVEKNTKNSSSYTYYPIRDTMLVTLSNNTFKLTLSYRNLGSSSAQGYVNYIGVNVQRKLNFNGSPLIFRNRSTYKSGKTIKYIVENASSNVMVWDVTDPTAPAYVETTLESGKLVFFAPSDTLRQFIVFSKQSNFLSIDEASSIPNQNIHGEKVPDLLIVVPPDSAIVEQARRLANFRRTNDGLDVLLVTTQQVYNEFSSGVRDVSAIRDMVKMFYDRNPEKMKYLLLFGKGTYANNFNNPNNYNLIPTYQSSESLVESASYVTDDFFGWMNWTNNESSNLLDIGVGRLPIRNADEAKVVVDKLINYVNPKYDGDWKNIITFVGDDEDDNIHINQSDELANLVETRYPYFQIRKIYLDAYIQTSTSIGDRYPDANVALNNQVNTGTLIVNYTGHGSPIQLAHEDIVDVSIIRSWKNADRLPLFVTATCSFSRFDDVDLQEMKTVTSAGEEILLNPTGGGIGLLTTTRLVFASDNFVLNRAFYNHVFSQNNHGDFLRLGDIMRLTKNDAYYTGINRLNFTLLGDPSMTLAFPKYNYIKVDSLYTENGLRSDTIRALDRINVTGHFEDEQGNLVPYNGLQYVIVYDKADTLSTLANDADSYPKLFSQRQNIIFRGKVEVTDGKFTFTFPVPKDIRYHHGYGKIIFYASDTYPKSYGGTFDSFLVGGVSQREANDMVGPTIRLFMNDTNFVDGGITDPNPRLLIKLYDSDGINATGIGIGHDITAILDDDLRRYYVLNDYYQSELNDFTKGTVVFPLINLTEGAHRVKVMAYDIYNNYSESYLTFRVKSDNEMLIERVYNYPNPLSDYTSFVIEHNWPNRELMLEIEIFSFSGAIVNKLRYKGSFEGYVSPPVRWNGTDGNGHKVGSGLYIYRVTMKDNEGNSAENYGKLLIVR